MHIPERMCIACKKMKPKSELIKIVKNQNGIELDKEQNKFGRGAYVCKDEKCIRSAAKRRALSRHFKIQTDAAIYEQLVEVLNDE